jgi:hypothetical protein
VTVSIKCDNSSANFNSSNGDWSKEKYVGWYVERHTIDFGAEKQDSAQLLGTVQRYRGPPKRRCPSK